MKRLIWTDFHLHTYSKFGHDDLLQMSIRLKEQNTILVQLLDLIDREEITEVVFGGDWFHKDKEIPTECLSITKWFFDSLHDREIPFYAVRGNHDLVLKNSSSPLHYTLSAFNTIDTPPKGVYFGHYDEIKALMDNPAKRGWENTIRGYDLVFIHETPINCKLHGFLFDKGVDWETLARNNKYILFGHIHDHQELSKNCYIAGPPLHLTFGDSGPRGVFIQDGSSLEFIPLKFPQFKTVDSINDVVDNGDYYRVNGSDSVSNNSKVVCIKQPTFYETRLKSTEFLAILNEWITFKSKDSSYLTAIDDLLQRDIFKTNKINDLKLLNIYLKNFLCFEESSLDINNGFNLIQGVSDEFSSNGSGKSSITEGIIWALFGETTKGLTGDSILRKYPEQQKDCLVEVQLSSAKGIYRISRSRKKGLSVYLQETGNDATFNLTEGMLLKEAQEYLENTVLGFGKELLLASVYFSQEKLLLLTRLGNADTNNLITDLLGFSQYDKLYDLVFDRIKENINKLSKLNVDIATTQQLVKSNTSSLNDYKETDKTLRSRAATLREKGESIKVDLMGRRSELENLEETEIDLSEYEVKETQTTKALDEIREIIPEAEQSLNSLNEDENYRELLEYKQTCQLDRAVLSQEYEKNKKELADLKTKKANTKCKACGSILDVSSIPEHIDRHEVIAEELNQKIIILDKQIEEKTWAVREYEKKITEANKYIIECKQKEKLFLNSLLTIQKDKKIAIEKANIKKIKQLEIADLDRQLEAIREQIKQLKSDYESNQRKLQAIEKQLIELEVNFSKKTEEIKCLTELNEKLGFWREAFGTQGIKSLLLDNFCNEINLLLSNYTASISNGVMQIEFSPTSITKGGEQRNKLELLVTRGDVQQEYNSLSGGEKQRADLAVCLSFSKFISNFYGLSSSLLGILIFDEIMSQMDESGEASCEDVLVDESRDKVLLIISHGKYTGSRCDRLITVKKTNKISKII